MPHPAASIEKATVKTDKGERILALPVIDGHICIVEAATRPSTTAAGRMKIRLGSRPQTALDGKRIVFDEFRLEFN